MRLFNTVIFHSVLCVLVCSCVGTSFIIANRSNIIETRQDAKEDGKIDNAPDGNTNTLAAEKTTDIDSAVSTSNGVASADGGKHDKKSDVSGTAAAKGGDKGNEAVEEGK